VKAIEVASAINPFLNFIFYKLESKIVEPNVWLFILGGKDDIKVSTSFVALKLKDTTVSCLLTFQAMLNNVTN